MYLHLGIPLTPVFHDRREERAAGGAPEAPSVPHTAEQPAMAATVARDIRTKSCRTGAGISGSNGARAQVCEQIQMPLREKLRAPAGKPAWGRVALSW